VNEYALECLYPVSCFSSLMSQEDTYSVESSKELLDKDIVQMHASQWHSLRKVKSGNSAIFYI